jgi:hypothetical protein
MAAGVYNISIEQGSTWQLKLEIDSQVGVDKNMTGYTVASKIGKSYYDPAPISLSVAWVIQVEGIFRISLSAAQTAALDPAHEYVYDVEITDSAGVVTRMIQGRATVSAGITS